MSESDESEAITIKKETLWKYSAFILAALLVVGAFLYFTQDNGSTGNVVRNSKVSVDDDAVLGDNNAPVTIIAFSDYQCPFCRKFWAETFHQLKKDYIDSGKVKFVFRDFPLSSMHPAAFPAAEATECARERGGDEAYWKMHDKIFEEQNILDGGSASAPVTKTVTFSSADLKKWAKDIGYDIGGCLDSGKYTSEIEKDLQDGINGGVQGTPAFFVNDKLLSGAQPYGAFKQAIDSEL